MLYVFFIYLNKFYIFSYLIILAWKNEINWIAETIFSKIPLYLY